MLTSSLCFFHSLQPLDINSTDNRRCSSCLNEYIKAIFASSGQGLIIFTKVTHYHFKLCSLSQDGALHGLIVLLYLLPINIPFVIKPLFPEHYEPVLHEPKDIFYYFHLRMTQEMKTKNATKILVHQRVGIFTEDCLSP